MTAAALPLRRRDGQPGGQLAGERGERKRAVAQDLVVERTDVERGSVAGGQLAPKPLDLARADLEGQRLARPRDVATGLDRRVGLGQARVEQDPDAPGPVLPE